MPIDEKPRQMRTALLAEALLKAGHSVVWFASTINHAKHERRPYRRGSHQVGDRSFTIVLLQGIRYRSNFSPFRITSQIASGLDFLLQTRGMERPDVIVGSYPSPELCSAGALYGKYKGIPFIIDIRDSWPDTFSSYLKGAKKVAAALLSAFYIRLLRYCISKSQKVISSTQHILSWVQRESKCATADEGKVIYLGYPDTCNSSDFNFRKEKPVFEIVFVASFGRSYDGLRFVEIAKTLAEESAGKIQCTFIGDGEEREAWEKAAVGVTNLTFTGWLDADELHSRLLNADAGAILLNEWVHWACPNKFFEYLCYGLVIVNSVPGELAEFVESEGIGINIVGGDNDRAVAYLQALALDPEKSTKIYSKSRQLFLDRFRAVSVYREYCSEVERLLP